MNDLVVVSRPLVYFTYGLAFIFMAGSVWLQPRPVSGLRLANSLPYLAVFGVLRGLAAWGYLFIPMQVHVLSDVTVQLLYKLVELLLVASFLALALFGSDLLKNHDRRFSRLSMWSISLFCLWLLPFVIVSGGVLREGAQVWMEQSEVWGRYLLALPAAVFSATGLYMQSHQLRAEGFPGLAPDLKGSSITMAAYGVLSGLLVPRAEIFPARYLNAEMFPLMSDLVQFLRAACAILIAFFLLRALRAFNAEVHRRLERAGAVRAAAEERERLALELHDGILQSIYAAGLGLQAVQPRIITAPDEAVRRVGLTLDRLNQVIDEIRAYIDNLNGKPSPGIDQAVTQVAAEFQSTYGLPVDLRIEGQVAEADCSRTREHLLAILRESLSNVGRHAQATQVSVHVRRSEDALLLRVSDDGTGFDLQRALNQGGHYGLRNLYRRADLAGGHLQIESGPGEGTRIAALLPIQKEEASK